MSLINAISKGSSLTARAVRSSALTVLGFGGSQVIRLISNLILTRLLFPEAFGLMALLMVVLQGLMMFSDVGIGPSIMQSKRGDDPDFLNTAWSIQLMRGAILWLVASLLAYPIALFYGEPLLAQLMPVAALTLVIDGFKPTRLETAHRHLRLGRLTGLDLGTQIIGVVTAVVLAWLMQSVWALVLSGILSSLTQLALYNAFLPGERNRPRWEPAAAHELIHFGKWIFLSTVCGFIFLQSDKLIIGKYLSLGLFGVYNIGYFLASFPLLLGGNVTRRVLIPIYRECPPGKTRENFLKLRKMRFLMTASLMGLVLLTAAIGVVLVRLLYDPRYESAGAVVALMAVMQIPQIIVMTYDQAALAAGDSRRFFVLTLAKACFMVAGLIIGLEWAGLLGALLGQGAAMLCVYPVTVWLARRQGAWDPLHDAVFAVLGLAGGSFALWLNWASIIELVAGFTP